MDGQIRAFSSVVFLNSVGKARIVQLACPLCWFFKQPPRPSPSPSSPPPCWHLCCCCCCQLFNFGHGFKILNGTPITKVGNTLKLLISKYSLTVEVIVDKD